MKDDQRGKNWKGKVEDGKAPQPWKHTRDWANKRISLETKFYELLSMINLEYILPWRRMHSMTRVIGNTNKVLFIELITHHLKKTAALAFFDDESMGFLGIKGVFVSPENRADFDAGMIPSVDGKRRSVSGPQIKTLVKIWHTAGFVERVLEGGALSYVFDQAMFARMRGQALRAEEKRRGAKSPVDMARPPPSTGQTRASSPHREGADHLPMSSGRAAADATTSLPASRTCTPPPHLLEGAAPLRLPPMMSFCAGRHGAGEPTPGVVLPPLAMAGGGGADGRDAGGSRWAQMRVAPPSHRPRGAAMESPTGPAAAEQPAELVGVAALLEAAAAAAGAPLAWAVGVKRKVELDGDERGGGDWKAARRDPKGSALASSAAMAGAAAGPVWRGGCKAGWAHAAAGAAFTEAVALVAAAELRAAAAEARAAAAEARAVAAERREAPGGGLELHEMSA